MTAWSLLRLNHIIATDPLRSREATLLKLYLLRELNVAAADGGDGVLIAVEYVVDDGAAVETRGDALVWYPERGTLVAIECKCSSPPSRAPAARRVVGQARRMADRIASWLRVLRLAGGGSTAMRTRLTGEVEPVAVLGWRDGFSPMAVRLSPTTMTRLSPTTMTRLSPTTMTLTERALPPRTPVTLPPRRRQAHHDADGTDGTELFIMRRMALPSTPSIDVSALQRRAFGRLGSLISGHRGALVKDAWRQLRTPS
ncbi:hypothetical protein HYH03_013590 [Edaphochlamys debaryana]|uniref:Uncharacterized protein n=1 Tax=Edaphochlamys debaryana TaxID=47281 RepID=A0A835XVT4_9CHLO|nr:hypothetical protein HYH03_013590 [Edaphochlamys debaryana]|eukprot:KAG2487745.1 hypothetical protein HYH03_013590 [Edaphochlamys debaryana]